MNIITGLHIMGEFTTKSDNLLKSYINTDDVIRALVTKSGFSIVGEASHQFNNGGYTIVYALAESHLSLHTWPELHYVTFDLFVCNLNQDNSATARSLFNSILQIFSPDSITRHEVIR